jgi:hypothetical protein
MIASTTIPEGRRDAGHQDLPRLLPLARDLEFDLAVSRAGGDDLVLVGRRGVLA